MSKPDDAANDAAKKAGQKTEDVVRPLRSRDKSRRRLRATGHQPVALEKAPIGSSDRRQIVARQRTLECGVVVAGSLPHEH